MSDDRTPQGDAEFRHAVDGETTSWWPVDLAPILAGIQAGELVGPVPQLMARSDGPCLLYPGEIHSLAGEPETGKGWIALQTAAAVLAGGGQVLYLDCEDSPTSIVTRLIALGASPATLLAAFTYVRPDDPFTPSTLDALLAGPTYTLAVIDGLSEAYTLLGLNPYDNVDAAKFLNALPRPIAAAGAAVLLIDHVVKDKTTRGRYALGAQHKLAGIATAYTTHAIDRPSRTSAGLIKLTVEKDRHGHVRSHAHAGTIALARITPTHDGSHVTVDLDPPQATTDTGDFQPTVLMERVAEYVRDNPGASRNTVLDNVTGHKQWKAKALDLLVAEGYIDRQAVGRQRHAYHPLKAFTQQPGPTGSQPSPGPRNGTGSNRVPPLRDPDPVHTTPNTPNRVP